MRWPGDALKEKGEVLERIIREVEKKFGETVKGLQENFGNLAATKMNEQQTRKFHIFRRRLNNLLQSSLEISINFAMGGNGLLSSRRSRELSNPLIAWSLIL